MVNKKKEKEVQEETFFAFIATFLSIVGFIIAFVLWKDNKYVMYYARQSLVVFIFGAAAGIVSSIFIWVPIMGVIIDFALGALAFLAWLLCWLYALSGKKKEVPILGRWARGIRL